MDPFRRLRHVLALILPRWLAIALGVRRVTPWGTYWPRRTVQVPELQATGGTYRAPWRPQDPGLDPREPNGGESSSAGTDHGWSNCTMSSAALAIAYQEERGRLEPWGGDMRHRQADRTGGTDLYDAREAWASYGETLTIRSGSGWSNVVKDHNAGRAIVIQGEGNVPGAESFDGGHACVIAPESQSDGDWLFGDPLATGWQWATQSSIRSWAERWQSSIAYAVGELPDAPDPEPPPVPTPVPPPPPPPPGYPEGYANGVRDGIAQEADRTFASWIGVALPDVPDPGTASWDDAEWIGEAVPEDRDTWAGPWPVPLEAAWAAQDPATWDAFAWTGALWGA